MKLLRFTGQQPRTFMAYPYLGEVEPGEFEARDADAVVLLQRDDVEDVNAEPAADAEPAAEPEPAAPAKTRKSASKSPEASEPAATDPSTSA